MSITFSPSADQNKPINKPASVAKTTPLSPAMLPPAVSLFDEPQDQIGLSTSTTATTSPAKAQVQQLQRTLEHAIQLAKPPLTADQQESLHLALQQLEQRAGRLNSAKPETLKAFESALNTAAATCHQAGLMHGPMRTGLQQVVQSAIAEMGKPYGLQVLNRGSQLMGLGATKPPQDLAQKTVLKDSQQLLKTASNWSIPSGPMDASQLLVMGLRDQINRLINESQLPPPNEFKNGALIYEDKMILQNAVTMADKMLQGGKISPDLLKDFTDLVATAKKQGGSGLKSAFEQLTQAGTQAQQMGNQLNSATGNLQTLITTLSNVSAPDLVTPFNDAISNYATSSNAARSTLPPLPFPITLPTPIAVGTGANQLTIPAGSTLSYNAATNNYTLNTNGLSMQSGGTLINAGTGTVILGQNMDQLSFANLGITSGSTQVNATNTSIQVNKLTNSSQIQAQQIHVDFTNGQVDMTNVNISQSPNQLQLGADSFGYTSGDTQIQTQKFNFTQTVQDGVTATTGQAQGVDGSFGGGTQIKADKISFALTENANDGTSGMVLNGQNVQVTSGQDQFKMGKGTLNIQNAADGSTLTTLQTTNGQWTNGQSQVTSSAAGFQIAQNPAGQITQITAQAQNLNYQNGKDQVKVNQGNLTVNYGENGQVSQVIGQAGKVDWLSGEDSATINGLNAQANYGTDGKLTQITAGAEKITYKNPNGTLAVNGGQVTLNYGEDGALKDAQVNGNSLSYTGKSGNGEAIGVNLGSFSGSLVPNEKGGQDLSFQGQDINATVGKTTINLDEVKNLQVSTGADGQIQTFHAEMPGTSSVQTKDLQVALNNAQVDYKNNELTATVESLSGKVTQTDLTGQFDAKGVKLWDTEQYSKVHLDSASVNLKELKDIYKIDVQNVDLILDKNAAGQMTGGALKFEDLQGKLKGYTVTGTNAAGQQTVLSFGLSEDGKWLQQLGLEIPKGGELKVSKDDWFLKLGGNQQMNMTYDPAKQTYTLDAKNFNAQYSSDSIQVDVGGLRGNKANLNISMTPDKGIVINDISNLSGKITLKDVKGLKPITIDIDKMKGFYLKQTNISGDGQGMMLHLMPTGKDSVLTAEIRTSYKGIPLGVKFDNVHQLSVGGEIQTNRAKVYIGDPSGRGNIEITAGPLKLEGSEIEIEAKYHMYDPQRMLNALDKLSSDTGIRILGDVLTVDPIKGKATLDTSNERGPYAQLNVLFPSPVGYLMRQAQMNNLPFNGIRDEGMGLTLGLGARWKGGSGTRHQLGLDAGLVPGSYLSIHQTKGSASLFGVPLPKYMPIGTTAMAGLNYKQKGTDYRLAVQGGVLANPAAFLPDNPYLYEDRQMKWGTYMGMKLQTGPVDLGFQYTANGRDWDKMFEKPKEHGEGGWNHQGMLTVGGQF